MAPTWPEAVWAASTAYTEWMASEPAFARLGLVEILAMGASGRELLDSLLDAFALFLRPGYRLASGDMPQARDLDARVATEVFGLLHRHVLESSPETLATLAPQMALIVLRPFLGEERADAFVAEQQARGA